MDRHDLFPYRLYFFQPAKSAEGSVPATMAAGYSRDHESGLLVEFFDRHRIGVVSLVVLDDMRQLADVLAVLGHVLDQVLIALDILSHLVAI